MQQHRTLGRLFTLLAVLAVVVAGLGTTHPAAYAASTTVVVTPSHPDDWVFVVDNGPNVTGSFVNGPDTPPLGTGSVQLTTNDSSAGIILFKPMTDTIEFASITSLSYSTYRSAPADPAQIILISMAFNIDHNLTDANIGWQGRLVYEPYYSGSPAVQPNVWQTWNPMAANGKWWRSKPNGDSNTTACTQSNTCTWAQVLATWPHIGFHPLAGATVFKAGSGWSAPFVGNIDAFSIGIGSDTTIYDFETDTPAVIVTESDGATAVSETGPTTDTYTLMLDSKPTSTVTVTLDSTDGQTLLSTDDGTIFDTTGVLTFTNLTWNQPQTVTVQAVDDALIETTPHTGTIHHTITPDSDVDYASLQIPDLEVSIDDNDVAGVVVVQSGSSTDVAETGPTTDTYTLALTAQPTADVTVTLVITDGQTTAAPTSVTFTPANWSVPQTITVTAVDDPMIEESTHKGFIGHEITADSDPDFVGTNLPTLTVNISDNDSAGVTLVQSGGAVEVSEEGTTSDTYTLVLNTQPTADVIVTLVITDGQTTATPTSVTFTPANWNIAQTVSVTAVDDAMVEGTPHFGHIGHTVSSTDPDYAAVSLPVLAVSITDNDVAGVTLVQTGGAVEVSEAGPTSDTYTLVLNTQPTANVVVTLVITDGQTTATPTSVTFTPANWNIAQTITVTAVDDALVEDSPHSGHIGHMVSSTDMDYAGLSLPTLTVSITDNDEDEVGQKVLYLPLVLNNQ